MIFTKQYFKKSLFIFAKWMLSTIIIFIISFKVAQHEDFPRAQLNTNSISSHYVVQEGRWLIEGGSKVDVRAAVLAWINARKSGQAWTEQLASFEYDRQLVERITAVSGITGVSIPVSSPAWPATDTPQPLLAGLKLLLIGGAPPPEALPTLVEAVHECARESPGETLSLLDSADCSDKYREILRNAVFAIWSTTAPAKCAEFLVDEDAKKPQSDYAFRRAFAQLGSRHFISGLTLAESIKDPIRRQLAISVVIGVIPSDLPTQQYKDIYNNYLHENSNKLTGANRYLGTLALIRRLAATNEASAKELVESINSGMIHDEALRAFSETIKPQRLGH